MPRVSTNAVAGRALRELAEGGRASLQRLAEASGRSLKGLERQAARDGWQIGGEPQVDWLARLNGVVRLLVERLETMISATHDGDIAGAASEAARTGGVAIPKTTIDGMVALVRGTRQLAMELGEEARRQDAERAARGENTENRAARDDEIAEIITTFNDRIVDLARQLADRMVREEGRY